MSLFKKYNGTKIGFFFTVGSLILTVTYVFPILSVIPGAYLEEVVASVIDNDPYSNVGKATLSTLFVILLVFLSLIILRSRKTKLKNFQIIVLMLIGYFIVHSLGVYIYWATSLNFRSDGQLLFAVFSSYPVSSFGLILIGLFIDFVNVKRED